MHLAQSSQNEAHMLHVSSSESPVLESEQEETIGTAEDDKLVQLHKIRKTSKVRIEIVHDIMT